MNIDAIWKPESQQQVFRKLLEAISRPGNIQKLNSEFNGYYAGKSIIATLMDSGVTLADPHGLLNESDWGLIRAERSAPSTADYIFCDGSMSPDFRPKQGTLALPEKSATIILAVASITGEAVQLNLRGPGIENTNRATVDGLNTDWVYARNEWVSTFPLGVDMFIVDNLNVIGLPRTTSVEVC